MILADLTSADSMRERLRATTNAQLGHVLAMVLLEVNRRGDEYSTNSLSEMLTNLAENVEHLERER